MRQSAVLLLCVALAGCNARSSPSQVAVAATDDDTTCRGYGAAPGSAAYVQCRTNLAEGRANRTQAATAACEQRRANRTAEVDRENAARAGTTLGRIPRPGEGFFGYLDNC